MYTPIYALVHLIIYVFICFILHLFIVLYLIMHLFAAADFFVYVLTYSCPSSHSCISCGIYVATADLLMRRAMVRCHFCHSLTPRNLIIVTGGAYKTKFVRTCKLRTECILKSSELLHVAPKILRHHGPWALRAHGFVNLGGMVGIHAFQNMMSLHIVVSLSTFYSWPANSHTLCFRTLCLLCVASWACVYLDIVALRISITRERPCAYYIMAYGYKAYIRRRVYTYFSFSIFLVMRSVFFGDNFVVFVVA